MHFRSLLFVPGNKESMLRKAMNFRPDALVPDMEDSVPDAEKANARNTIAALLPDLAGTGIPVIPRVNALDTGWTADDLDAVVGPHVHGISIGKVHVPDDIHRLSSLLDDLEAQTGLEAGRIKLFLWLESARAMVHCYEICSASPRIEGVAFGGEDFTHDMGIEPLEDESQDSVARNLLCIAA
ncbi:MAG: CoA ester lyase, partial [Proteobacteria bacterium]|nr:CoA ester lyase [Pseudomonadota bacterium]